MNFGMRHLLAGTILFMLIMPCTCVIGQHKSIAATSVVDLVKRYQQPGQVWVVNFWSTWCKPCLEEIPHFVAVANEMKDKGVKLLLVSQDTRSLYQSGKLDDFVRKRAWKAEVVWLAETNADYYCPVVDSSWSGVIPVTVVINLQTGFYRFVEDSLSEAQLRALLAEALKPGT
jgi:thiol-disulfide isomerase/thioredoxin